MGCSPQTIFACPVISGLSSSEGLSISVVINTNFGLVALRVKLDDANRFDAAEAELEALCAVVKMDVTCPNHPLELRAFETEARKSTLE